MTLPPPSPKHEARLLKAIAEAGGLGELEYIRKSIGWQSLATPTTIYDALQKRIDQISGRTR